VVPPFLTVKIWSRVFYQCDLVPRFPVPRFPPPYFSWYPVFHSRVFSVAIITQKFLESGNSFLPNDADFSDIEKRKKFHPQIYHPQEWCNVMTEARSKSKPFEVVTMQPDDFFSTKPLELGITNGKRDTNKDKVNWLKMRQIQYRRSDPKSLFYKCSHSIEEDWKQLDLEKRGSCVNLTHVPLPKL